MIHMSYPGHSRRYTIQELIEREATLVAEACYLPNTQFLSIPFRSELMHSAA
jgi:hypothetical protein